MRTMPTMRCQILWYLCFSPQKEPHYDTVPEQEDSRPRYFSSEIFYHCQIMWSHWKTLFLLNIANIDHDDQDHDHVCWFSGENLNVEWNERPFSMSSPVLLEIFIWWKSSIALVALKNIFTWDTLTAGCNPRPFSMSDQATAAALVINEPRKVSKVNKCWIQWKTKIQWQWQTKIQDKDKNTLTHSGSVGD